MNVQETSEIRELTLAELDQVSGGNPAATFVAGAVALGRGGLIGAVEADEERSRP